MPLDLKRPFILDGATGTELQKLGMERGACPEIWVLEHPEAIKKIQRAYAKAGSDCVYAPTFGANRASLKQHGITTDIRRLCLNLVSLSREAVPDTVLVAGDIAPCGLQLMPYGMATFEDLVDIYTEQAEALEEAGVDFYAIETQMSIPEARAALIAVKNVSKKPVLVSFACNESGRSVMGANLISALLSAQELGAYAYGINCCGNMALITKLLGDMRVYSRLPLISKPNAGLPDMSTGKAVYKMQPEAFAAAAEGFVKNGAAFLGGCCGTDDAHIAALSTATRNMNVLPPSPLRAAVAASQSRVIEVTSDTTIIQKEITDDLLDAMEEVIEAGGELMKLHIRDEDDIEAVDDCQYGLSIPLCVSFESDALKNAFLHIYNGKPYIL
ncbi:MAG: homocysteine S-methyltransferase family protein [Oscillospiraceae bacterium]